VKPTAKPTSSPTVRPSYKSTQEPTAAPSKRPSTLRCSSVGGDFGDISNVTNALFVDFSYEMTLNASILNETLIPVEDIMNKVEVSVSNLLIPSIFPECGSSRKRFNERYLRSVVEGISARPNDFESEGEHFLIYFDALLYIK
jgi:hypothetical protein